MFQAKGDHPQWQVVFDRLRTMSIDEVIKDSELQELLPDAPEASVRAAFHRAVLQVEREHNRTFARVRTVGYRMVDAPENENLARGQHVRARRRLKRARQIIDTADGSRLTPELRRKFASISDHMATQASMLKRLEARQEKTEARVAVTEKDSAKLSDRVDRLTDLLARHGITD